MRTYLLTFFSLLGYLLISYSAGAQDPYTVRVNADGYKHVFEGAGASFGKWADEHYRMSPANQDQVMRWAGQELNMQYLQDYVGSYPAQDPGYFNMMANYVKDLRKYRPAVKMCVVLNNLPARLTVQVTDRDGVRQKALDVNRRGIYDQVADWYFKVLEGFKVRDVPVSIINIVNEPDHKKRYLYGYGDAQKGVAFLLKEAVPRLKAMINNPSINTNNVPMPRIMAASTLSTRRAPEWGNYLINNYPSAWRQVDIFSTHQYARGADNANFDAMRRLLNGRSFIQSEMVPGNSKTDDIGALEASLERGHYTSLSFANLFTCAVNGGVNSWWYFFVSTSAAYKQSALISTPARRDPFRYKQFYSFKQLTSLQPPNSHVMERKIDGVENADEVIVFRKRGQNVAYVNIANYKGSTVPAEVIIEDGSGQRLRITSVQVWTTNARLNASVTAQQTFPNTAARYLFNMSPHSLNTVKVEFERSSSASFTPDPNKKYYIDNPAQNVRLAASGQSQDAYTTRIGTTGANVEWQFVRVGNYWHIQRAAGGSFPRLRTDNSANADMQQLSSSANWTQWQFAPGATASTTFLTLPNANNNYNRLSINRAKEVKMVSDQVGRALESFRITEVTGANSAARQSAENAFARGDDEVILYPNPANTSLTISLPERAESSPSTLEIVNLQGQQFKYLDLSHDPSQRVSLDIQGLPKGIYVCRLTVNGATFNRKLHIE